MSDTVLRKLQKEFKDQCLPLRTQASSEMTLELKSYVGKYNASHICLSLTDESAACRRGSLQRESWRTLQSRARDEVIAKTT